MLKTFGPTTLELSANLTLASESNIIDKIGSNNKVSKAKIKIKSTNRKN